MVNYAREGASANWWGMVGTDLSRPEHERSNVRVPLSHGYTDHLNNESEKVQVADPRSAMDIKPGYRGRAFTSDLSGQEFWLVVDKGFQPMGLVMGNCIYSMGAVRNWLVGVKGNFQGELKEYSQLMYQARELALSRMQFEADQLGADGVIGVDIKVEFLHNNEWMEVTAIGTAIRYVGGGANMPPVGQGRVVIPTN